MSLRIQTNNAALQAQRVLGINNAVLSKSIEKLTSGYRINRSADDAAGLGIANKFRADAKALSQASRNVEQATSVLQIAEGSVSSVASILDRMKELATQAASDTVTGSGRALIDQEFTNLRSEVGRIVETTRFQGSKLLDNGFGVAVNTASTALTGTTTVAQAGFASGLTQGVFTLSNGAAGVLTLTGASATQTVAAAANGAQVVNFSQFGVSVLLKSSYSGAATNDVGGGVLSVTMGSSGGKFMVGSSGQYTSSDMLALGAMDLRTSGTSLNLDAFQLDSLSGSQNALAAIDNAILSVNTILGSIGASQNRMEYAQSNLKVAINNTVSAESVIRDLDMADEMTKFSKTQVLVQAGTAMLAQANATSQGALSLIRG